MPRCTPPYPLQPPASRHTSGKQCENYFDVPDLSLPSLALPWLNDAQLHPAGSTWSSHTMSHPRWAPSNCLFYISDPPTPSLGTTAPLCCTPQMPYLQTNKRHLGKMIRPSPYFAFNDPTLSTPSPSCHAAPSRPKTIPLSTAQCPNIPHPQPPSATLTNVKYPFTNHANMQYLGHPYPMIYPYLTFYLHPYPHGLHLRVTVVWPSDRFNRVL